MLEQDTTIPGTAVVRSGPWDMDQVAEFLLASVIPIRLATSGLHGPLVQSLWFEWDRGALWCATQQDAVVARRLEANPVCGFEVAADRPPYRGVRGQARAGILPAEAPTVLPRLLDRYLAAGYPQLRRWLESRLSTEVALRLELLSVSSWDYSPRMAPA